MSRWIFLTLRICFALIAVILFTGLIGRVANQYLANRFAKVATANGENSEAIYQLLLAMEEAGVEALVQNAISNDQRIATKARDVLFIRIDTWLSELSFDDPAELSNRLHQLLGEIKDSASELTKSGRKWSDQIAYRLMEIGPRLRIEDRGKMISAVDSYFVALEQTPVKPDLDFSSPKELTIAESFEAQSITTEPKEPRALGLEPQEAIASLPMATEQFQVESSREISELALRPLPEKRGDSKAKLDEGTGLKPWQPSWQTKPNLADRNPKRDESLTPKQSKSAGPEFSRLEDLLPVEIAELDDRQLLSLLLDNAKQLVAMNLQAPRAIGPSERSRYEKGLQQPSIMTPEEERLLALRQALTQRGYSTVQLDQIRLFLSEEVADRVRLAEQIMVSYSGDHSRLLLQLSNDSSAEVRLVAISVLGSSSQRVLVEAAWQKSLRDNDPRIAALADSLQAQLQSPY